MLDKLLSSLQGIPAYSILISAVVVIFIAVSVLVMNQGNVLEQAGRAEAADWAALAQAIQEKL